MASIRWHTFSHAVAFVLGFSAIFIVVWGGAVTVLGSVLYDIKPILSKVGGVIVIIMGLATLGVVRIPLLYRDTRPQWSGATTRVGLGSSALQACSLRQAGRHASARPWARSSRWA
jgi:cytochrome c-type biogenesis protein